MPVVDLPSKIQTNGNFTDAHILAPEDEELARAVGPDEHSHYQDESWEGDDEETVYGGENRDRQHAPVQLLKPAPKRR